MMLLPQRGDIVESIYILPCSFPYIILKTVYKGGFRGYCRGDIYMEVLRSALTCRWKRRGILRGYNGVFGHTTLLLYHWNLPGMGYHCHCFWKITTMGRNNRGWRRSPSWILTYLLLCHQPVPLGYPRNSIIPHTTLIRTPPTLVSNNKNQAGGISGIILWGQTQTTSAEITRVKLSPTDPILTPLWCCMLDSLLRASVPFIWGTIAWSMGGGEGVGYRSLGTSDADGPPPPLGGILSLPLIE